MAPAVIDAIRPFVANFPRSLIGQSAFALSSGSDFDFLGDSEGVIHLNTEVSDGALNIGATKQQYCPEVAGPQGA